MKKILSILLLAVLIAAMIPSALAENTDAFIIDERAVFNDMSRSYLQGYEPVISWDRLTMVIPIRSEKAVGSIQAELIVANEDISPFKPQSMSARTQRVEDGLWAARFNLNLFSDRTNGDYPCTVRISGADADGRELTTDLPTVIHIRDGQTNTEPAQISISENTSSLNVGEDGVIAVKLTNASRSIGFENLSLTLSDPSGDILPKELDTVVLGDLMPGESLDLSFPVTVLSSAKVTPHNYPRPAGDSFGAGRASHGRKRRGRRLHHGDIASYEHGQSRHPKRDGHDFPTGDHRASKRAGRNDPARRNKAGAAHDHSAEERAG